MVAPNEVYRCKDPLTGPHNRCRHPVAPPGGYQRCASLGCAVVITNKAANSNAHCVMCQREAELLMNVDLVGYQRMMEG